MVKSSQPCAEIRKSPTKAPIHHWDEPAENWDRINIDYAGPFQGYYFLKVIDAKSRWAEIKVIRDAPTSDKTIELLRDFFCFHGYPRVMVSDNAKILVSEQFKKFLKQHGIFQKSIAPGHPAINGWDERNVQTLN